MCIRKYYRITRLGGPLVTVTGTHERRITGERTWKRAVNVRLFIVRIVEIDFRGTLHRMVSVPPSVSKTANFRQSYTVAAPCS